jgi:uncharacterized surface protein with fasciclin (FAS1) repeats
LPINESGILLKAHEELQVMFAEKLFGTLTTVHASMLGLVTTLPRPQALKVLTDFQEQFLALQTKTVE